MSKVYVIMGVSGCGKTTIGKLLAKKIKLPYYDADDFHTAVSIEKMKNGIPLGDTDRKPWLAAITGRINKWNKISGAIISCSALKESYRDTLSKGNDVTYIYLKGDYDLIHDRIEQRGDHFFKENMLQSQFDALEEPLDAITINVNDSMDNMIDKIIKELNNDQ